MLRDVDTEVAAAAPESCLHNLHRRPDDERAAPEPTQLCRNEIGVFHMLDCPLFLGLPCTYYERAAEPHPTTPDVALEGASDDLHTDFLSWKYRRRVLALGEPRDSLGAPIVIEPVPEPVVEGESDDDDAELELRAPDPPPEEEVEEPRSSRPELYPGQRRSEDRTRRRPRPQDESAEESDGDEAAEEGDEPAGEPDEPAAPRTVEEVLADLPEAKLPDPQTAGRRRGRGRGRGRGGRDKRPREGAGDPQPGEKKGARPRSGQRRRRRRGSGKKPAGEDGAPKTVPPRGAGAKPGRKPDAKPDPQRGSKEGGERAPRRRRRRRRKPPGEGGPRPKPESN